MLSSPLKALERAKQSIGGYRTLAATLRITPQAVSQWKRVPVTRVLDVERITGVPRHELRPDFYPPPTNGGTTT
jgi:DNA-binding transcriptional regulator YdaS (Cro superfamily)